MKKVEKALIVLEQDDVELLIHALEDRMDQFAGADDEYVGQMGDIHGKLMELKYDSGSEYRVK